jgi:hypothetical protein
MLEIPTALKPMLEPLRKLVSAVQRQVERSQAGSRDVKYEGFEETLSGAVALVERSAHEVTLSALDVDAPKILINGQLHTRVLRDAATFMSQPGEVRVTRSLYRRAGDRNGPTVDIVAVRAGAIDGVWLPGAARDMAYLLAQGTSREAVATAREMGRLPYSRSSFDRVGHAVGEKFVAQHQQVEEALIESWCIPDGARSLSVSLDRVSIPMEEPRPRPPGRPCKGAAKRPISRVYRMAYCGTVTVHDEDGAAIHTIRYGTMPEGDPGALCEGMASDVLAMLRKRPGLPIMRLCDGAPEMWKLLDRAFDGETFAEIDMSQLIDFWHVVEKLSAAASVIGGKHAAGEVLARWKLALLNRCCAREKILDELVASGKDDIYVSDERPVHDAITYLTNNATRMDYASARRSHLPIGSGNVEATCKSLVAVRMKRPGARWKTDSGEHIIHLRALALSDRWTEAMDITLRPGRTHVRVAA